MGQKCVMWSHERLMVSSLTKMDRRTILKTELNLDQNENFQTSWTKLKTTQTSGCKGVI